MLLLNSGEYFFPIKNFYLTNHVHSDLFFPSSGRNINVHCPPLKLIYLSEFCQVEMQNETDTSKNLLLAQVWLIISSPLCYLPLTMGMQASPRLCILSLSLSLSSDTFDFFFLPVSLA